MLQTIIFDKDYYTKKQADAWLKKHKFIINYPGKKKGAHETTYSLRYRQAAPKKKAKYTTIKVDEGIQFVLQY